MLLQYRLALVITGVFKVFDVVYMITGGGPLDASQLLSTYMYQKTFTGQNQGYGCTIAVLMMLIGFYWRIFPIDYRKRNDYLLDKYYGERTLYKNLNTCWKVKLFIL